MHNDWKVVNLSSFLTVHLLFLPLTLKRKSLIYPYQSEPRSPAVITANVSLQAFHLGEPVIRNVTGLVTRNGILVSKLSTGSILRPEVFACMYSYRSARRASYIRQKGIRRVKAERYRKRKAERLSLSS